MSERDWSKVTKAAPGPGSAPPVPDIHELEAQILYLAADVRLVSSAAEEFLRSAASLLQQQLGHPRRNPRRSGNLALLS